MLGSTKFGAQRGGGRFCKVPFWCAFGSFKLRAGRVAVELEVPMMKGERGLVGVIG